MCHTPKKTYNNRIQNGDLRKELIKKIKPANELAFGTKAANLTYKEYNEIAKTINFPRLQKNADSISYSYSYDGFLPDYSFSLSFQLAKGTKIDTTELSYGTIAVDTIANTVHVFYSEYQD